MKALILAAGMGQRLGAWTADQPKALVPVTETPLLAHVLQFIAPEVPTAQTAVVGGYQYDRLTTWIQSKAPTITMFENRAFTLGSIESLRVARDWCDTDLLITNVDHIYHPSILAQLLAQRTTITAACDFDRDLGLDDMKIATTDDGHLSHIHKTLTQYHGGYIGMTFVPRAQLSTYWEAVDRTYDRHGPNAVAEWVLGELAEHMGQAIAVADLSGLGWAEVDTPEDRHAAEQFVLQLRRTV